MFIRIYSWGSYSLEGNESEIGLSFKKFGRIEVVDEKLFFLAVIRYGIDYRKYNV